jgi:hypothetical protein
MLTVVLILVGLGVVFVALDCSIEAALSFMSAVGLAIFH